MPHGVEEGKPRHRTDDLGAKMTRENEAEGEVRRRKRWKIRRFKLVDGILAVPSRIHAAGVRRVLGNVTDRIHQGRV